MSQFKWESDMPEEEKPPLPKLQTGPVSFDVMECTAGVSKTSGEPMLTLRLLVEDFEGNQVVVYDYLLAKYPNKIKAFLAAIGKDAWFQHNGIDPLRLYGTKGKAVVKVSPPKNDYGAKWVIGKYIASPTQSTAVLPATQTVEEDDLDGCPF